MSETEEVGQTVAMDERHRERYGFERGRRGAQAKKCGQPLVASNPGKRIPPTAPKRECNTADIVILLR